MIFVTVGTQLHFDRMVRMVDAWAGNHPAEEVLIQTGNSAYTPKHCEAVRFTTPEEWEFQFKRAGRVVSHAGMGTILKSLTFAKPLIIMARREDLGEHRNDHQRATAARMTGFGNLTVVETADELFAALSTSLAPAGSPEAPTLFREPSPNLTLLISELKRFTQNSCQD